jgi:crotonobetainyl-CoA:carnitine CoA-transferase CaiB-like acyl-CoA transferase
LTGEVDESLLLPSPVAVADWGVPGGTLAYATGLALACGSVAGGFGNRVAVSELGVAIQLYLPYAMAASYGARPPPAPPPPIAAPGGGWLNGDLGSPDDRSLYDTLLGTLPATATAAEITAAAQEWRIPVCEYRPRPVSPPLEWPWSGPGTVPDGRPQGRSARPLHGITILDLTTMWAGPLATWLLQTLGADIYKVEPDSRPDGTRAADGGGIYPGGVQRRPGWDSALWNALNADKQRLPLDLRQARDRDEFLAQARSADVIIDSFSPRVMPNFGLDPPALAPLAVSMPAFPPGPERDWVAYGTGIHARLGLGERSDRSFAAPAVAYPDAIAGFTGALAVMVALAGRWSGRIEVPLLSATAPLLHFGGRLGSGVPDGRLLLEAGMETGEFAEREVAGMGLAHPVGPFRFLPPARTK